MKSRRFRRRVTRVIKRLVGVFEASFCQIFVFNEEASLQAVSDTCHYATGRRVRGNFSFAENGLGPPPIEGFVSPDSVLHRLSAELYSVIYPSISTWEAIRGRMTANEAEWSLPLSKELPEGLSDESAGRVAREVSPEAIPSTSGSRQIPRVDRLRFPGASGRLRIMMQTLGSFKDYLRPIGSGRTDISLCVATTGRGYRKKILGTSSESVGLGGPPRRLERILRILDIEDRRYNIFIEPDLLATFSLGPVPSSSVKTLVKANKKRVDTMKLNKSRLKQLAQSGEVAVAPVSLKRKKPNERSSRQAEEPPTCHTVRDAVPVVQTVPPVVMVDVDTAPPSNPSMATINQSSHVAMDRAKGAGLNEAMVMSQRCIAAEEGLATLRAKYMADEAEMKNAKRAVMELTREKKDALAEAEKLKKELKAMGDDVKVAVDAKDKAVADLKHLVGQIEGAKEAAVSEFRAFEVFEDINTRYFLSGFEAFRKQAVQRFPGLDFSALQPYNDEDSVVDASQDQAGDEDVSSK
uniref:Uncharacterized protein n=1 Tax=Fagus sylvatica TaxID=28930 RepID=A0A2N9EMU3_FAGSY